MSTPTEPERSAAHGGATQDDNAVSLRKSSSDAAGSTENAEPYGRGSYRPAYDDDTPGSTPPAGYGYQDYRNTGPHPQHGIAQPQYGQPPQYGTPQYGQPQYGQPPRGHGPGLMPGDHSSPPMPRPMEVRTAFWLWVASIALGIVGLLLGFYGPDGDVTNAFREGFGEGRFSEETESFENTVVNIVVVLLAAAYIVWYGLTLFFAFMMRSGANWARIVLTVFAALMVLFSIPSLTVVGPLSATLVVVRAAVLVAAVIFVYSGHSRGYFVKRSGY